MLEGGEGAGKTTLARNLSEALCMSGRSVVTTREPGGTPWGERIRTLLTEKNSDIDHFMSPMTQLAGYYMARFENLERTIIPALKEGKVVISDRFELSGYAYQVHAQGGERLEPLFLDLHKHVVSMLRPFPCLYIICDIDPTVGLARVKNRGERETHFDAQAIEFHHKVREGMHRAKVCIDPHFTCITIDASRSPEEMLQDTLRHIS